MQQVPVVQVPFMGRNLAEGAAAAKTFRALRAILPR